MPQKILWLAAAFAAIACAARRDVSFSQPSRSVEAYDLAEVTVNVTGPDAPNPFIPGTSSGKATASTILSTEPRGHRRLPRFR